MIESILRHQAARQPILDEIRRCWETIRVARHHMRRPVVRTKHPKAYRYQLTRLTVAIIHADRAEQSLAAIPKPYVLKWRGGAA